MTPPPHVEPAAIILRPCVVLTASPLRAELSEWTEAAGWAEEFWARVAGDPLVSAEFAAIARAAGAQVGRMREVFR